MAIVSLLIWDLEGRQGCGVAGGHRSPRWRGTLGPGSPPVLSPPCPVVMHRSHVSGVTAASRDRDRLAPTDLRATTRSRDEPEQCGHVPSLGATDGTCPARTPGRLPKQPPGRPT